LFEVARGALVYGYFFYPLYTLASDQLYRVAEGAVAHKCKSMEAPGAPRAFMKRIDWLVVQGAIPQEDQVQWHAFRKLRNAASHPERQKIIMPVMALTRLSIVAERINGLFGDA
jgi:hypothetical protein